MAKLKLPVPETILGLVVVIILAMVAVPLCVSFAHTIVFNSDAYGVKPNFWFYFRGIVSSVYLLYIAVGWRKIWETNGFRI